MIIGSLRHFITIEQRSNGTGVDAQGNTLPPAWAAFASNVPAAKEPLSAREILAAQSTGSEVSVRWTIRYLPGVTAAMRIKDAAGLVYNILGAVPDNKTGVEWLTIPSTQGVNDG